MGLGIFLGFEAIFLWAMFRYLPRASRNTLAKPIFQGRKEWTLDAAGVRIVGVHSDSLIRWGGIDALHITKRSVTFRAKKSASAAASEPESKAAACCGPTCCS